MLRKLKHKKTTIKNRKQNSILKDKRFALTIISITLGIVLVSSNVLVSRKTYEIIDLKYEIDKLASEQRDLKEELETVLSPAKIKDRALELEMVEVETIEELISIGH